MDNFFSAYLNRLENMQRDFHQALDGLPAEALDWAPGNEMNSMAVLLAHTAGSLRYWIGDVALGEPSGRVREREFQTQGLSAVDLLGRLDQTIDFARGALPRLSLNDLEKECMREEGKLVTCSWALLHALEHASVHLGHIQLTSQLWKEK